MSTSADTWPGVSVVIPAWNSSAYLAEAIDSVLGQTRPPAEVLVIDDGSDDDSATIAASFGPPVRVVHQTHAGQGRARNHGAELAAGPWLAFLDADDLWLPHKLEVQLTAARDQPGTEIVFGRVEQFFSPELGRTDAPTPLGGAEAAGLLPSSLCCRRDAFFGYGGFAEGLTMGETLNWYARAREQGARIATVEEVVVRRRIHTANTGVTHRDGRRQFNAQLKEMLDRRRAATSPDGGR